MELAFKPFHDFIEKYTTPKTRGRYKDSQVFLLEIDENKIEAGVVGSDIYNVRINFNANRVTQARCSCPYDYGGYCKHIVHVLAEADEQFQKQTKLDLELTEAETTEELEPSQITMEKQGKGYMIKNKQVLDIRPNDIEKLAGRSPSRTKYLHIFEAEFPPNRLLAKMDYAQERDYRVEIQQKGDVIYLKCSCSSHSNHLCTHLQRALQKIIASEVFRLPFDQEMRHSAFEENAEHFGMENVKDPDDLFEIKFEGFRTFVVLKANILPVTKSDLDHLEGELLPDFQLPKSPAADQTQEFILAEISYGHQLRFTLMQAPLAKNGNMKSPVRSVNLQEKADGLSNPEEFRFMTALMQDHRFSDDTSNPLPILKNPLDLPFYYYKKVGWQQEKITPKKINPIRFFVEDVCPTIKVQQKDGLYKLALHLELDNKTRTLKKLDRLGDFLIDDDKFYYLKNENIQKVIEFFKSNGPDIFLTPGQFPKFKAKILDNLEEVVKINYSFIRKAPKTLVKKQSLDQITDHLIYLSESADYILITPVIRYGEIEAPILSRQNVYAENNKGKMYVVERNEDAELRFQRNIQKLHPEFEDDPVAEFYYLHKQKFLDEGWFIDAFEEWRKHGYSILGFKQLKNNNLNPHKMKVTTSVDSGIDWFDIHADVKFGDQEVGLKKIRKSVLNKNRYVKLGDGTKGILPEEWIEKFSKYFRSGEIKDSSIRTHKSQFGLIEELFEEEVLSADAKMELATYKEKLADFHSIRNVEIPKALEADLRNYQKEGLNWLNFLDEFGFGGCLADDMGLGKTVQIIAYFLSQIEKGNTAPNLVVVPTSLLFNWETEINKFAPKLTYKTAYGPNRATAHIPFVEYNVILTSYGTMLNDIEILKKVDFNVIVLDESQAIKNPSSKRYKASRLLKARQRIVATGTPVENNTFDLYAQMSFAMPGLLGSAKQFADDYSTPIDKFKDDKRAAELQQKVTPFVLRRSKKQVATELPDKTEMVVHCEMGKEQRRVYDAYKKEFQRFLKKKDEEELKSSNMHILQGLTKMRQICNSPALLSDREYYGSTSAKLDELTQQIKKLQGRHKVVIFSQFVSMLELVKDELDHAKIPHAYLTGQTRNRQEQVDKFQEDETIRVFLISLKAGGTGLNLTEAEYVFIVDPWWNPAVENQAIDRTYRIGQTKNVVAIRMITPDTIEEKIQELQDSKKQLVKDLIHTDSGFFKQLTKDDLMDMV